MFIYFIYNTINGKYYIGQTSTSLKRRWSSHRYYARHGFEWPLYRAIRKYGEDAFRVWLLLECQNAEELGNQEKIIIKALRATDPQVGYNLSVGGPAPMLGRTHSSETLQKMSEGHKGHHVNLGRIRTLESRQKQSASAKGKPKPAGFGEKISKALKGKPKSEEHRAKFRGENNPMFGKGRFGKDNPMFGKTPWNKGMKFTKQESVDAG